MDASLAPCRCEQMANRNSFAKSAWTPRAGRDELGARSVRGTRTLPAGSDKEDGQGAGARDGPGRPRGRAGGPDRAVPVAVGGAPPAHPGGAASRGGGALRGRGARATMGSGATGPPAMLASAAALALA